MKPILAAAALVMAGTQAHAATTYQLWKFFEFEYEAGAGYVHDYFDYETNQQVQVAYPDERLDLSTKLTIQVHFTEGLDLASAAGTVQITNSGESFGEFQIGGGTGFAYFESLLSFGSGTLGFSPVNMISSWDLYFVDVSDIMILSSEGWEDPVSKLSYFDTFGSFYPGYGYLYTQSKGIWNTSGSYLICDEIRNGSHFGSGAVSAPSECGHSAVLPVPLPASGAALLIALGSLVITRKRRKTF